MDPGGLGQCQQVAGIGGEDVIAVGGQAHHGGACRRPGPGLGALRIVILCRAWSAHQRSFLRWLGGTLPGSSGRGIMEVRCPAVGKTAGAVADIDSPAREATGRSDLKGGPWLTILWCSGSTANPSSYGGSPRISEQRRSYGTLSAPDGKSILVRMGRLVAKVVSPRAERRWVPR